MKVNRLLGAVLIIAAIGSLGFMARVWSQTHCFRPDALTSQQVCGSTSDIERYQFERGRGMAGELGSLKNPVGMCISRAQAQGKMYGWPNQYREAYERGCLSGGG